MSLLSFFAYDDDETEDFQDGVVSGYHACANDMTVCGARSDEELEDVLTYANPDAHSEDWYRGWGAGYQVRRGL